MKSFLHYLIQFTWGLPQNLIGLIVFLTFAARKKYEFKYKDAFVSKSTKFGGLCLGLFIFVSDPDDIKLVKHEYGHTLQSLILGPLWLFVIGIPSLLWNISHSANSNKDYYSFYTEKWANILGNSDISTK